MPRRAQYTISWLAELNAYSFIGPAGETASSLQGEEWLQWLGEHTAFAFHGRNGQLNLLKERRRSGEGYWYAYQRQETGMVKRYLGRSEQLNLERLEEVATLLRHTSMYPNTATSQPPQFEPLLMPKLQLPRLQSSLLPREQLWPLLDKGLEYKLTLIAGPAGYGKTTAIGQWLAKRRSQEGFPHVAYLTLDEGDNDVIRFWRYIIAACQDAYPDCGKEALALLRAHRLPPFKPLHMMLTTLLNELSQLEYPTVLILDDCHVLHTPQVIETLSFFLDHLPTSLHLYMLIRGDPPFSLTRLRARNELLDIYPPHLAFSLEETRAFFERVLSFSLTPKEVRQIHEHLEGWGTGLRLLAMSITGANDRREVEQILQTFTRSHWSVRAYLFEEVLHTLTSEQQEFLLESCILPLVNAELCDVIRERQNSAVLLQDLRASDLFLIPLHGSGGWARYHPLFADTMRQEAHKRLGEPHLHRLLARASAWYEAHNLYAEAIETALDATNFMRALDLLERFLKEKLHTQALATQELYTLHRWFRRLPEKDLAHHPDLCVHYAMTHLFLLMEEPQLHPGREYIDHLLRLAEQRWRDINNTEKLAEIFAFRALLSRQEGNILQAVTWARQALAWLPQEDRTWRNLALTVVGTGEILAGDLREARRVLLEALALNEQQGNFLYARATRGMLAWVGCEQGTLHHTAEQFRQMLSEARTQEDSDDIARSLYGLAQIYYQWNDLEKAEPMAREALEVSEQMHIEEVQAQASILLALIEQAQGQGKQAQQRLTAWLVRTSTPHTPLSYQHYREVQTCLARLQLAHGSLAAVERWFSNIEQSEEALPLLKCQREHILKTRYLLAQGSITVALEQLNHICAEAQRTDHIALLLEAQVVMVLAYARQGTPAKAFTQLQTLLETTHSEGYTRLFLDEGEEMALLLRGLLPRLTDKTLRNHALHLLNAFAPSSPTSTQPSTPGASLLLESLSPQEERVLRLLASGNSNADIARELVVSVNTIRTQLQSVYRKLNVSNRVEASNTARQLGLV
ncbi:LuxR C-terminal-related transcriptional regulator [Ktedonobacter racemifer]|uniref:ATP-dependent transcriptional regulator, MalT-like, LuxR family n=1 Tax=Ktedonobacter racemifer DSM 44963 TaxID=485913 RepID=D6TVY2_KTERA|nr:LuxR C-terminal-related transcriptional regulator [Ktedonobacter racemifer]EFH84365.1 ATP-dependent transcriptional regulator, MalT-like, LuxR family [Ktedonobacter racemifer DSM 44963]